MTPPEDEVRAALKRSHSRIGREVEKAIERYTILFEEQARYGWPERFRFPEPSNAVERVALELFTEQLRQATGRQVLTSFQGGKDEN